MRARMVFLIGACLAASLAAQEAPVDVESLFDGDDDTIDPAAVIDYLTELLQKPLDLNRATEHQLRAIPWLAAAAGDIVKYRKQHQAFTDVEELKKIKSVRPHFEKVKYFVAVGPPAVRIHTQGRHRVVSPRSGGENQFYRDTKFYNRLKAEWRGHASFGLLAEKDVGEQPFADLLHGFVRADLASLRTQVIIGNFTAEFGQRLVFGGSYNFGKGGDPIASAINSRSGLYPYLSVDENYPFRGIGASTQWRSLSLTTFYSDKRRDARIESGQVVSLPTGGLHRTDAERAVKNRLHERSTGAVLTWRPWQRLSFGFAGLSNTYDAEFAQGAGASRHQFSGSSNQLACAFGRLSAGTATVFGEYAGSSSTGRAAVIGGLGEMSPVEWVVLWRKYDENFHSFYASAFGERNDARNETGFYLGCRYHLAQRSTLSFYYDQFSFLWPTATLPMPASGDELLLFLEQGIGSRLTLTLHLKLSNKAAAEKYVDALNNTSTRITAAPKSACRLQLDYQPSRTVSLRTRFEWSQARENERICWSDTGGVQLFQQIAVAKKPYRLAARWTVFDAVRYPLRFYQVEQDVPGALRLMMLYGRGVRWYVVASYSAWKMQFALKFEQTAYDIRMSEGDRLQSGLSLQADWRF